MKCLKSSFLATKSVSQLTSTRTPIFAPWCIYASTRPSFAALEAFFKAISTPFLRSMLTAFSMSPPAWVRASLQSMMPAPDTSLNRLTESMSRLLFAILFFPFLYQRFRRSFFHLHLKIIGQLQFLFNHLFDFFYYALLHIDALLFYLKFHGGFLFGLEIFSPLVLNIGLSGFHDGVSHYGRNELDSFYRVV